MNVLVVWKKSVYEGGATELKEVLYSGLRSLGYDLRIVSDRNFPIAWAKVRQSLDWADLVICGEFPATATTWPSCKVPIIWLTESVPELFYSLKDAPLLSLHRHVVKNGSRVYSVYPNRYLDMELNRFYGKPGYFLPFGVDHEFFSEGERLPSEEFFTILHVGYIGRLKGQLETLRTFGELLPEIPNLRLVFIGPKLPVGSGRVYWNEFVDTIERNGWKDKVFVKGQMSKEIVRSYYYTSDVLIHPVGAYGGQLAPFEALSTGLPVVVSKRFLGSEYIEDFGLVTDNYAKGIHQIYRDWEDYHERAMEGREWIRNNLTWAHYVDRFDGIIKEVVG